MPESLQTEQFRQQREFLDQLSRNPATASGELESVTAIITESCARLMGVERVGVWLFNEKESELHCIDLFNSSSRTHTAGAVLREHEFHDEFQYMKNSLFVDAADPLTDPRTSGYVEGYIKPNRITSMLDIVIRFGGRNLGTLCFEHVDRPHVWAQHEIDFGCLIGAQLSILLERRELRRAEDARQEIQNRLKAAEELDALKSRFFSNMSHEFRTPLTLLLGPVETLLAGTRDIPTEWQRRQLSMIRRGALRMLKLVNALMDSIRVGSGGAQTLFRPTDLATLTRELAGQFESAVTAAGLRLRVDCPPLAEPLYVDRDMWEKIVLNFLSNALKFTFSGEIAVALHLRDSHAELTIRDTGIGIAESSLPHLFDRFYRVPESRGRTMEGTGIGLALVKELVQLHGGSVDVESQLGHGTTFHVRIPRGFSHLPTERVRQESRDVSLGGPSPLIDEALGWLAPQHLPENLAKERTTHDSDTAHDSTPRNRSRILVADDNADLRNYLLELLGDHYEVEGVADGREALVAARRKPPDLILSDIMMPHLDGIGLLNEIRSDADLYAIPVLLVSARTGEDASADTLTVTADDYLCKPFSGRELLARVNTLLTIKRSRELLQGALDTPERDLETLSRRIVEKFRRHNGSSTLHHH